MRRRTDSIHRIHLATLVRMMQRGWNWSAHSYLTLIRSPRGHLYRVQLAPIQPGRGCFHIEPFIYHAIAPDP